MIYRIIHIWTTTGIIMFTGPCALRIGQWFLHIGPQQGNWAELQIPLHKILRLSIREGKKEDWT